MGDASIEPIGIYLNIVIECNFSTLMLFNNYW